MKNSLHVLLVILVLICLTLWTTYGQGQKGVSTRQAWKYKSISMTRDAESNSVWKFWVQGTPEGVVQLSCTPNIWGKAKELGDQGWKLV